MFNFDSFFLSLLKIAHSKSYLNVILKNVIQYYYFKFLFLNIFGYIQRKLLKNFVVRGQYHVFTKKNTLFCKYNLHILFFWFK